MSRSGRWQVIKNLDAFPRAEKHLMQKTSSGAAVSAVVRFIMAVLFVHELRLYLQPVIVHEMSFDTKRGVKLPIHINLTFPVLSLGAIDMSGKHEVDLDTNIWKLRVHRDGHILGSEFVIDLVEGEHKKKEERDGHKDEHQDLEGHEHDEHGARDEVRDLHISRYFFQRDSQQVISALKNAIAKGDGCQVFGVIHVQRGAGTFHISMHGIFTKASPINFEDIFLVVRLKKVISFLVQHVHYHRT